MLTGFSSYLDKAWDEFYTTDATIHPYITHFDDYSAGNFDASNPMGFESVTNPPPSGNLVMPMGSSEDIKDYVLDIDTDSSIDLIFAVGCTYAVSAANKIQRFTPEYRVPQHNKKAASEVGVEIVSNDLAGGNVSSSATLRISVVDINHGVPVGTALDEMRADSSVSAIEIEIPGITAGIVSFSTTPISGTGHDQSDPLIFEGDVLNALGAGEGSYQGLVKVTDSCSAGLNESPLLNGMDGIKRVGPIDNPLTGLFAIDEFATYQVFNIDVSTGVVFEVLSIDPSSGDLDSGDLGVTITGSGFDMDAETKLVKNDNPSVEIYGAGVTVDPSGTSIECAFNMDSVSGAQEGIYHVVVTNPGPPPESAQLSDGFEINIFTGCVETYRDEIYSGTLLNHAQQIHSLAFTSDGLMLSRVNDGGYHIYAFDVTQNGNISGTPVVTNALYMNNSIGDIDVCDVTGNIVYAICGGGYTQGLLNTFVVYSPDGVLIGEYLNENTDHLQGLDTDDDGSIWTIAHTYLDPNPPDPNYSPYQYYLNHYIWDSANTQYVYDDAKSANVTPTQGYQPYANIYDIAVSFTDDLVMVYSYGTSYRGRIDAYDTTSSPTVRLFFSDNLLPASVGSHAFYNWRTAGDIEIDHTDLAHEYCRVLISARNYWTVGESFSKIDTGGNVIDQWLNSNADAEDRFFWTHAFNTNASDPDGVYMVATEDLSSFGGNPAKYHVFEMPAGW
jgi:hypothetical protein